MTKKLFTDQELQSAARLVRDAMLSALPEPEECEDEFSDEFYARMDKLIKKYYRHQSASRWIRRIAAVFIAAIIGITSWLTVDVRAREALFDWVRTVYENFVEYRYYGDHTDDVFPQYELSWLPEGFEIIEKNVDNEFCSTFCLNIETNDVVIFEYSRPNSNSPIRFLDEASEMEVEEVTINGFEGEFFNMGDSNTNNLIWIDTEQNIIFTIDSNLEKSVLITIAEHLELLNSTK